MPACRISVGLVVNPLIRGLAARSRMEARSAPSAKILTRNKATSGILRRLHKMARASGAQNILRGFAQRADAYERPIRTLFGVTVVHENGAAAGAMAGFDVAPTVAHNEARLQVYVPYASRFEQQPRLRLAAGATRRVIMRTDADSIQPQKAFQALVHLGNLAGRNQATRDVRLIGDQNQSELGFAQPIAGLANAGQ